MSSRLDLGSIQLPIQWILGALFPSVKRLRHEADDSSPTRAEVKKTWVYALSPSYVFVT
jgi:hypothetical protein